VYSFYICHTGDLYVSEPFLFTGSIIDYDNQPVINATQKVYEVIQSGAAQDPYVNNVREAVSVIEECLQKYR
jgi:hypothetical protein